jgi:putative transposase
MARLARVVAPGLPHHVTQRGNRRQPTFFNEADYVEYRRLMSAACQGCGTQVWAYCLMPNHVHLIMVPAHADGLRRALAEAHRRYTRLINLREGWRGHLWQERFHSFVMDERHLLAAARYIERNPVRAGLCTQAEDWPWSSAQAHLAGLDDGLVTSRPPLEMVPRWDSFLGEPDDTSLARHIHAHTRTGRPLGPDAFVEGLERRLGRALKRRKPGPKPRPRDRETRIGLWGTE